MDRTYALAAAAGELVGVPFRLQGRDPVHGLDCIGMVLASLAAIGVELALPADYRPRRRDVSIPEDALRRAGLERASAPRRPGDILLLRTAPAQVHLAIARDPLTIVHAHAGLGRVVESPLPDHWPILAAWRLNPDGDFAWRR